MRKTIIIASVTAITLSAGAAMALTANDVITANPDLFAGSQITETRSGIFGIRIQGVDANGQAFEYRFRNNGTLRKSDTVVNGVQTETRYDANGAVASTDTSTESDNSNDNQSAGGHDDSTDNNSKDSSHDSSTDNSGSDHGSSGHDSGASDSNDS